MERQVRNPVTGGWEHRPEPRRVSVWHTMFYALMLASGPLVLLDPPAFLSLGMGGGLLTAFWGCLLVFGGPSARCP